jgi:hypothetical protein
MPSFLPARFRQSRTAAVETMGASGIGSVPQSASYTRDQQRAAMYARRVGFVRRSYEFISWQAARCELVVEQHISGEWVAVTRDDEPMVWATLDTFRGRRATPYDLVRSAVFLDDTVGEFFLVLHETDGAPVWSVRSPSAVNPKKHTVNGQTQNGYLISDAPGGTPEKGTGQWVPADRVYRHWQPSVEHELIATSSLLGLLDDLDTYWTISRTVRRTARSRLATGGFLWTPSEAHTQRSGSNGDVSELEYEYAQAAALALNDADDTNVASIAPFLLKSPGTSPIPQWIDVPGLTADQLAHLQDARMVVADALPLSTSSILSSASGNHWNEWLASEEDVELIEDRLTRVVETLTAAMFQPTLNVLADQGVWVGDPETFRIRFNADPIRRRPDNSANALQAIDRAAIGWEALRRELHFGEGDAPTEAEVQQILSVQALRAGRPAPDFTGSQTPPEPVPPMPAKPGAVTASVLPVIDDRWLLTR